MDHTHTHRIRYNRLWTFDPNRSQSSLRFELRDDLRQCANGEILLSKYLVYVAHIQMTTISKIIVNLLSNDKQKHNLKNWPLQSHRLKDGVFSPQKQQ